MASSSSSTELVNEEPERQSLQKPFIKTAKKSNYGSLRKEAQQTTTAFIVNYKHRLTPGETLLGISLRYGVPTESIKKANRLWSNDLGTFVKEHLLVPMSREKLRELKLDENTINEELTDSSGSNGTSKGGENGDTSGENNENKFKDYLNKYDTFISESKMKLKSLETNPNLIDKKPNKLGNGKTNSFSNGLNNTQDDNDDFFKLGKRLTLKKTTTIDSSSPLNKSQSSNGDPNTNTSSGSITPSNSNNSLNMMNAPDLVVIASPNNNKYTNFYSTTSANNSRAKLAQESLQRLEKEKDDLYEL